MVTLRQVLKKLNPRMVMQQTWGKEWRHQVSTWLESTLSDDNLSHIAFLSLNHYEGHRAEVNVSRIHEGQAGSDTWFVEVSRSRPKSKETKK